MKRYYLKNRASKEIVTADFDASSYRYGQCKIFDNKTFLVIGIAGFE